jgi:hypothetical protein
MTPPFAFCWAISIIITSFSGASLIAIAAGERMQDADLDWPGLGLGRSGLRPRYQIGDHADAGGGDGQAGAQQPESATINGDAFG